MDFVIEDGVLVKYTGPGRDVSIPAGIAEIGEYVFACCEHLQSVTIPEGVTTIGERAFWGCSSLQSLTIPKSVTTIGKYAFSECFDLQSVTILEGVTQIGEGAFSSCTSLESVILPESITQIGDYAFYDCYSELRDVIIPQNVTEIGKSAFACCDNLKSVTILAKLPKVTKSVFKGSGPILLAPRIPISGFDHKEKPDACCGFAKLYCDQVPMSNDIRSGYLKYIRKQRKRLYARAMEYPPLLQLMVAEEVITQEDFEEIFPKIVQKGSAELTALLLEYRNRNLKPADLEREFQIEEL